MNTIVLKPRLRRVDGLWRCSSGIDHGEGLLPRTAYVRWIAATKARVWRPGIGLDYLPRKV